MRLRDDAPPVTQPRSRKRKTSPTNHEPRQLQPPPQPVMQHSPAPPHPGQLVQSHPGLPPPGYQFAPNPADYSQAGLAPPHYSVAGPSSDGQPMQSQDQQQQPSPSAQNSAGPARTLSQSKRAEQNRKAQRAFRERRDQHVKALESRSQLLDAALASADEANRRWEECRALVDQLRIENAALRAALSQAQVVIPANNGVSGGPSEEDRRNGDHPESNE
ncbi:uncharacterized protein STEHIDRAFT_64391 [Stereum hirsutum FP-91666 SS1]|uniref:uncharacterized protein n=1 Tax=Stereum hirsutum (strain FP-91666) TaxID=721885 RepID=UPI000444A6BF|nr:uncharacterized protein STEHIDRAFT_64391 [Stereum hirsutum FP-91666 SS1]EIM82833.1 hypothetical protein STEHIDRAFT_64391 [Stereum hirsutum FP-91666 SS1]